MKDKRLIELLKGLSLLGHWAFHEMQQFSTDDEQVLCFNTVYILHLIRSSCMEKYRIWYTVRREKSRNIQQIYISLTFRTQQKFKLKLSHINNFKCSNSKISTIKFLKNKIAN